MNTYRFHWRYGLHGEAEGETAEQAFANLRAKIGEITRFDVYEVLDAGPDPAIQAIRYQARLDALEEAATWHEKQADLCVKGRSALNEQDPVERKAWEAWEDCENVHRASAEAIRAKPALKTASVA